MKDISIVGAGMVGRLLAQMIRKHRPDLSFEILDPNPLQVDEEKNPSFDGRATAVSAYTLNILKQLGLYQPIDQSQGTFIKTIEVSQQGHANAFKLEAEEMNTLYFGQVLDNRSLGRLLAPELEVNFSQRQITGLHRLKGHWQLTDSTGKQTQSRLVVLTEGGRELNLYRLLGLNAETRPYNSTAIVQRLHWSQPVHQTAIERFGAQGPYAFLPYGIDQSLLVMPLPHSRAEEYLRESCENQKRWINRISGHRFGEVSTLSTALHYPLSMRWHQEQCRRGLVLLGNAACSLHPVAGQGFNLAARSAERLLPYLAQAIDENDMLNPLLQYDQVNRPDQSLTRRLSDQLVSQSQKTPLLWSLGMHAFPWSSNNLRLTYLLGTGHINAGVGR